MKDTRLEVKEVVRKAVNQAMEHPEDRAAMFDFITGLYGMNVWADMCGTESEIFNQDAMDKKQLEDIAALQEQEIRKLRSFLDAAVRANQICKFCALDGEENSKSCIIHEGSCGGFFDSRLAKVPNVIE